MSDDRLDRAIRAALGDVVAGAPRRGDSPQGAEHAPARGHRPWLAAAAAMIVAVGIAAVVAIDMRPTLTTDIAEQSLPATTAPATPAITAAPATTMAPSTTTTVAASTTSTTSTTDAGAAPTPGPLQRVEFQRGTNNRAVSGDLQSGTTDRYVLEAAAGQTMIVHVDTDVPEITFSIFAPDGNALAAGEVLAAVDLPADGDYVVEVLTTSDGGTYEMSFLID
jgi:hypothetical protein